MTLWMKRFMCAALTILMSVGVGACALTEDDATSAPSRTPEQSPLPRLSATLDGAAQVEYRFKVVDQDGDPVEGVYVQFCNDEQCMILPTDVDGAVVFDAEAGKYTAHLLTTPEGYQPNTEEYEIADSEAETVFTLTERVEEDSN